MFERRKEFGLRNRKEIEPASPSQSEFERDRPMYERLRSQNSEIDQYLTDFDAITAQQAAGNGVPADEREKERIKKRLEEIREQSG